MVFNLTFSNKPRRGFTLIEYMFATTVGVMVLAAALLLWGFASRTCAMLYGYVEMSDSSKTALDRISQKIRNSRRVMGCTPTTLDLLVPSETTTNLSRVVFTYTPTNTLVQTITETGQPTITRTLLTRCTNFQVSLFNRTPISNSFDLNTNLGAVMATKVVSLQWRCTRPLRGDKDVIEDQLSARIVIRSK